jgi:hypothetical protein
MKSQNLTQTTTVILRVIFFILMLVMAWLHTGRLFNGLTSAHGMEQAQIAREVARGNGLVTKVLRPAAVRQNNEATENDGTLSDAAQNTYHAPLKPLLLGAVFRAIGAQNFSSFRFDTNEYVYSLDRVVAGFSVVCLLLSIGMTYVLASRIFDPRIAATTAILMLVCELLWNLSMSGLPQMLMLLFFTTGCYFAYRAFEATEEEKNAIIHAILAAVFFTLLALTHWIAVWILIGYAIAAALFIKPRGVAGIIALVLVILASIPSVLKNIEVTGVPGGTAYLVIFEGLAGSEEYAMRNLEVIPLPIRSLVMSLIRLTLAQTTELYSYFGAILAAPIFFLSLLHPFKNTSISNFRWAILIMWVCAMFGMAIFGLNDGAMSSNQLHILFAPVMAAYGLAMITVLWNRLNLNESMPFLRNVPFIVVVLISGSPLLLTLPVETIRSVGRENSSPPAYPPYAPSILDDALVDFVDFVESDEIIASDQPWAVAWYTDRRCLWMPIQLSDLEKLENRADSEGTPIVAVLTTPISSGTRPFMETASFYGQYLSLILDGWAAVATGSPQQGLVSSKDQDLSGFRNRYPSQNILFFRSSPMMLYSSRNPES